MVDTIVSATAAGGGASALTNQILTAYDRVAMFALREDTAFDQFSKVKPGNLTSPGNPVKFLFWSDLSVTTTPLNEVQDVEAVGLSDSLVTVTPAEYGKAVILTIRVRTDDFLIGFDSDVANILSWNMVETLEALARDAYDAAGTEVILGAGTEGQVVATDVLTANQVRRQHAELRSDSVRPIAGKNYVAVIHPDVAYDLKSETGDAAWLSPHIYVDTMPVYANELGTFGGFRFIETPRTKINADGGSSNVDTYTTYFLGAEAMAKAESIAPHMVLGLKTDKLQRLQPLGWHFYLGFGELREASSRRVIGASSIGAN